MMSEQSDTFINLLSPFGLSRDQAKIYLLLGEKGALSALQISRDLHLARTKVYRNIDKLIGKKLVISKLDNQGQKFLATSYQELKLIVNDKEQEVQDLKQQLPIAMEQLAAIWGQDQTNSKVLYYSGIEGLEQVNWNSLKAKDTIRIFEIETMNAFLDQKFAEKVRNEIAERKIINKQLTNNTHILPFTKSKEFVTNWWEGATHKSTGTIDAV